MDKSSIDLKAAASDAVPGQSGFDYLIVGAGFKHNVAFGHIVPKPTVDVLLLAPRMIGPIERRISSRLGIRLFTAWVNTSRLPRCSRLAMISAMPNMPMNSATMLTPGTSRTRGMS